MAGIAIVPEYFWSRCDQLRSAVNVRFFTGVHAVLTPITPKLKSGLQVAVAAPNAATKLPQINALPVFPYFS